jgi:hypothetical protein
MNINIKTEKFKNMMVGVKSRVIFSLSIEKKDFIIFSYTDRGHLNINIIL